MDEREVGQVLLGLSEQPVPTDIALRAKQRMFEEYDASSQRFGAGESEPRSPELGTEFQLTDASGVLTTRGGRRWRWIPAAAAAACLAVVLAVTANPGDESDPAVVVAADSTGDHAALEDRAPGESDPGGSDAFVDDDLPRLIEGVFSTDALGGSMTLRATQALWLTRHETGLVELSRSLDSSLDGVLAIGYVERIDANNAVGYLGESPKGVTGQVAPFVLDGMATDYWRGRLDPSLAGLPSCEPGAICLELFDQPGPMGLRAGVLNDVAERPAGDDGVYVLVAALPYTDYGVGPFEGAFDELVATIEFGDTPANDG